MHACLNPDPLFGDKSVAWLRKGFNIATGDASMIFVGFAFFKRTNSAAVGEHLMILINLLHVLPISSADCERGFSQINLCHNSGSNRLLVSSVNDLLMIGVNGPPLEFQNVTKYVMSCLKAGHHGALDKATGLVRKKVCVKHSAKLFN